MTDDKLTTHKIKMSALKMLRIIAATTGEKQYQVLARILKAEMDKIVSKGLK